MGIVSKSEDTVFICDSFGTISILLMVILLKLYSNSQKMGNQCESCQTIEGEGKDTLVLDPKEDYSLQPEDFYNEVTRKIAMQLGAFKTSDEDPLPFVSKGPIKM